MTSQDTITRLDNSSVEVRSSARAATVIAIRLAHVPVDTLVEIKTWVGAIQNVLSTDSPDFTKARALATQYITNANYRSLAMGIIDIIEGNVKSIVPDPKSDRATVRRIVNTTIEGIVEGLNLSGS
jgi:hypothetical protein